MNYFGKKPVFGEELELNYDAKDLDVGVCVPMTKNRESINFTTSPIQLDITLNSPPSKTGKKDATRLNLSVQDVVIVKMDKADPETENCSVISLEGSSRWRIVNPADAPTFNVASDFEVVLYKITPPFLPIKPMIICMIKNTSNGAVLQLQMAKENDKPLMAIMNIKVLNRKQRTKWIFILSEKIDKSLGKNLLQKEIKSAMEEKEDSLDIILKENTITDSNIQIVDSNSYKDSEDVVDIILKEKTITATSDSNIQTADSNSCKDSEQIVDIKTNVVDTICSSTVHTVTSLETTDNTNTDTNPKEIVTDIMNESNGKKALEENPVDQKENLMVTVKDPNLEERNFKHLNSDPSKPEVLNAQTDENVNEIASEKVITPSNEGSEKQDMVEIKPKCIISSTDSISKYYQIVEETSDKKTLRMQKEYDNRRALAMSACLQKKNKK